MRCRRSKKSKLGAELKIEFITRYYLQSALNCSPSGPRNPASCSPSRTHNSLPKHVWSRPRRSTRKPTAFYSVHSNRRGEECERTLIFLSSSRMGKRKTERKTSPPWTATSSDIFLFSNPARDREGENDEKQCSGWEFDGTKWTIKCHACVAKKWSDKRRARL